MEHRQPDAPEQPTASSVLGWINDAQRRLAHLLSNLESETQAPARLLEVAADLRRAAEANPDLALACILLNQEEGSYAVRHCIDSAVVALLVARALQKSPNEILSIMAAALTMNVGMLRHQEQLQSRQQAISETELALIHGHPQAGVDMLRRAGVTDADWLEYVLLHHENEDGSGYPFGKSGADIPLNAKIISLADRYCARVSSRGYRKSLLPREALGDILLADHGSVDPMLTACFIGVLGVYPTGALVRLASGEIGAVCGKGGSSTAPLVHVLRGADGAPPCEAVRRDSAQEGFAVREMLSEETAGIRVRIPQVWA
jgi:HD-GYP domain-containing protein (c-di-GMP phosphodiesterase class II)